MHPKKYVLPEPVLDVDVAFAIIAFTSSCDCKYAKTSLNRYLEENMHLTSGCISLSK